MRGSPACRALLLLAVLLAGCNRGPATWPVSGIVVFPDDAPVTSGVVEFIPAEGGPAARATLGPDGRFRLRTGSRDGAVAGVHRIAVVQLASPDAAAAATRHQHRGRAVHPRYRRFETAALERTVEPGRKNEIRLVVEPAGD